METKQKRNRNASVRKHQAPYIVDGYKNGATLTELAEHYKCSASTISNILTDAGVKARRRGPNNNKETTNGTNEQTMQPHAV